MKHLEAEAAVGKRLGIPSWVKPRDKVWVPGGRAGTEAPLPRRDLPCSRVGAPCRGSGGAVKPREQLNHRLRTGLPFPQGSACNTAGSPGARGV